MKNLILMLVFLGTGLLALSQVQIKDTPGDTIGIWTVITFDKTYVDVEYSLIDMTGRICARGKPGKCNQFMLDRGNISPGIYILKLVFKHQFNETHQIIISD